MGGCAAPNGRKPAQFARQGRAKHGKQTTRPAPLTPSAGHAAGPGLHGSPSATRRGQAGASQRRWSHVWQGGGRAPGSERQPSQMLAAGQQAAGRARGGCWPGRGRCHAAHGGSTNPSQREDVCCLRRDCSKLQQSQAASHGLGRDDRPVVLRAPPSSNILHPPGTAGRAAVPVVCSKPH